MTNDERHVVVVGAGNAALSAAIAAAQQGARVTVLEKAPEGERGGNTYFTGGGFRFPYDDIETVRQVIPDLSATNSLASTSAATPPPRCAPTSPASPRA